MSLVDEARTKVDMADLVVAVMVEAMRQSEGQNGYANSHSISATIGGSTPEDIGLRLYKMSKAGIVERSSTEPTYQLTHLGAELLEQDVAGFCSSPREDARRELEVNQAAGL